VPVQVCVLKGALELTFLRIVRGDYPIGFAFVLEVLGEKQNRFDFFLVLRWHWNLSFNNKCRTHNVTLFVFAHLLKAFHIDEMAGNDTGWDSVAWVRL
jgi:hypothetical protein